MVNADTTSEILIHTGVADLTLLRCAIPIAIGADLDDALAFVIALGPAGEIVRLAGERAADLHGQVQAALRDGLAEFAEAVALRAPASTWIVTSSAPGT